MNRLHFWLTAKSNYNLNSPFLFRLYDEVLFARVDRSVRQRLGIREDRVYHEMVYKFADHFGMQAVSADAQQTLLRREGKLSQVLIVNQPHRDAAAESRLQQLCEDPTYQVALDLYDVALLIAHSGMARQHYRLK